MDKVYLITQIEKEISTCTKCGLCKMATNPVPGEGDINAEIVFVGEAPGATEDATGRPFVGRAGKLLEGLLNALKMECKDVWIGNIIKHRPPDNRDPLPEEISACEGFLTRQLEVINPKLIITLGRFSMNYFHKDGKISRDHGTLIKIKDYYVYPVYHPAAALRNGNMFEALKKDFARIPALLKQINEENSNKLEKDIFNTTDHLNRHLGLDI